MHRYFTTMVIFYVLCFHVVVFSGMSIAGIFEPLLNKDVFILTNDGKVLVGQLKGFDQSCNVAISDCVERIFDEDRGAECVRHGALMIRGDNISVVGEMDDEIDRSIDLSRVVAAPIKPIVH